MAEATTTRTETEVRADAKKVIEEHHQRTGNRIVPRDYLEACLFGYDALEWSRLKELSDEFRLLRDTAATQIPA